MRARALALLLTVLVVAFPPLPALAEPAAAGATVAAPRWTAPVDGAVTRAFEDPPHPYGPGHRGVDLGGAPGSPVVAAGDGMVVFAGWVAGRPVVSIDHPDGLRTTYEPVDASVGAGQAVVRGAVIGTLTPGHGGCPVEACLHWGVRRGETYLDPLTVLRPPRVRLLPMD
jgi:murein DD-endopeptidase MepM/ murein hydrolase activator NlpD